MAEIYRENKKEILKIAAGTLTLILAFALNLPTDGGFAWVYFVPYIICGFNTLYKMVRNILRLDFFDENFLMGIATIGALCTGEYPEAVLVMLLYKVGELFENIAVSKTRKSVAALSEICPQSACVYRGENLVCVPVEQIEISDILAVKAGELIPVDGEICEGVTTLDASALTGESLPQEKSAGDKVYSGCINISAFIKVRAEKKAADSTAAKILEITENAARRKAKTEKFISRFARIYTPAVVLAAVALAFIGPCFTGDYGANFIPWLHRALIFLVVSCPCALVISVPLGFFAGIGAASKQGILIKGSGFVEALSEAHTAVFDKTGTLTNGNFSVVGVTCTAEVNADTILLYAASVEAASNHPTAKAIAKSVGDKLACSDISETAGEGITGIIDGKRIACGNLRLMQREGIDIGEDNSGNDASSVVYVAYDGKYWGHIELSDTLKHDAAETVAALGEIGIARTVMLTGDMQSVAAQISEKVGIDEYIASLLPHQKLEHIEQMCARLKKGQRLIYAGDGINDAPSLSRADIGIAMGGLGSDAAVEAADVVLMDDDISKIAKAVDISKKAMRTVRFNIAFSLAVKAVVMLLGVGGVAGMGLAIFADVGVCVIAIVNSMSLLSYKTRV